MVMYEGRPEAMGLGWRNSQSIRATARPFASVHTQQIAGPLALRIIVNWRTQAFDLG